MKVAVCFSGHLRTIKDCYKSHYENLLSVFNPDVFFHTWDSIESKTKSWHTNHMVNKKVQNSLISFVNEKYIKQSGEVILVESIGDMLSLWEAGVKNTIVLFGVNLSKTILFYLIKLKIKKIIIALNNDGETKAGNKGAQKILDTLDYYFTKNNSKIALPTQNDFNDMTKQEITQWRQNV